MKQRDKVKSLPHAKLRISQRMNGVGKNEILKVIKAGDVYFARRETNTRSLIYGISSNGVPFKAIYNRKGDLLITVLPIRNQFQTNYAYVYYNKNLYRLKLYPDCYIESTNPRIMTEFEIYNFDTGTWSEHTKNKNFQKFFDHLWLLWNLGAFNEISETEIKKENIY